MVETVQQTSLALERLGELGTVKGFFNRDLAAKLLIDGHIDCTHAAEAYPFLDKKSIL